MHAHTHTHTHAYMHMHAFDNPHFKLSCSVKKPTPKHRSIDIYLAPDKPSNKSLDQPVVGSHNTHYNF